MDDETHIFPRVSGGGSSGAQGPPRGSSGSSWNLASQPAADVPFTPAPEPLRPWAAFATVAGAGLLAGLLGWGIPALASSHGPQVTVITPCPARPHH